MDSKIKAELERAASSVSSFGTGFASELESNEHQRTPASLQVQDS